MLKKRKRSGWNWTVEIQHCQLWAGRPASSLEFLISEQMFNVIHPCTQDDVLLRAQRLCRRGRRKSFPLLLFPMTHVCFWRPSCWDLVPIWKVKVIMNHSNRGSWQSRKCNIAPRHHCRLMGQCGSEASAAVHWAVVGSGAPLGIWTESFFPAILLSPSLPPPTLKAS